LNANIQSVPEKRVKVHFLFKNSGIFVFFKP